jgi:hypothetical protein
VTTLDPADGFVVLINMGQSSGGAGPPDPRSA